MTTKKVDELIEKPEKKTPSMMSTKSMYYLVLSLSIESVSAYLVHSESQEVVGQFTSFVKEVLELSSLNQELDLLYAIRSCIHETLSRNGLDASMIKGLSLISRYPSFLVWDGDTGKPIYGPVDLKEAIPYEEFTWKTKASIVKDIEDISGSFYSPQFCLYHLRERRQSDPLFLDALNQPNAKFGTLDVWILYQLTGLESFKVDLSIASKMQLISEENKNWDTLLLSESGLSLEHVPEVVSQGEMLGVTKSFVPLDDGTPIVSMVSHEGAVHSVIHKGDFTSVYLDTSSDLRLSLFSSVLPKVQLPQFNKMSFLKGESPHYLMDTYLFSISDFESIVKQLGVSLESIQRLNTPISPKPGFYVIPNMQYPPFPGIKLSRKWSVVGIDNSANEEMILWALIQSIVYTLKQQLVKTEIVMNRRISQLFVVGDWSASHHVLQYLADQLQMTITTIDTDDSTVLGSLVYKECLSPTQIKKTYVPLLDPLTSYSSFQEWEKIAKNLDELFGDL